MASAAHCCAPISRLDLLFQCSNCEGLDNCLCWLGPGLDAANTWNCEYTRLLHFGCGDSHEAIQHIGASLCFQTMFGCNCLQQSTLCHSFCTTSLHRLHRRQHGLS